MAVSIVRENSPGPRLTGDRCRCSACGEVFNSTGMFDRHRQGAYPARRCLSVAEMVKKGYSTNKNGFWIRRPRGVDAGTRARLGGDL